MAVEGAAYKRRRWGYRPAYLGGGLDPPHLGVPNIVIVITDGNDTHGNRMPVIELSAKKSATEIIAIGVGADVS